MSIATLQIEIARFLASKQPEMLCISGKWGVGKTFAWKSFLKTAAQTTSGLSLARYSYVSLFGINSLDALKYAIFENTVKRTQIEVDPTFETLVENIQSLAGAMGLAERLLRRVTRAASLVPLAQSVFSASTPAFFLSVRSQIVCFDDLERKGDQLASADVLGLASLLKEQRNCKIVLLLNEDALVSEDKQRFDAFLEKVVDVRFRFEPTPKESVAAALPSSHHLARLISEHSVALGITNIRTIRRALRNAVLVADHIAHLDDQVLWQATHSLVLFTWADCESPAAPSLNFIKQISRFDLLFEKEKRDSDKTNELERDWSELLRRYKFTDLDDFDRVLLAGVEKGYFDIAAIEALALNHHQVALKKKQDEAMQRAWSLYHGSFDQNEDQVVAAIYGAFVSGQDHLNAGDLNELVKLLKELGYSELSQQAIAMYLERAPKHPGYFDLDSLRLGPEIDEEIRAVFKRRHGELSDLLKPKASEVATILLRIHKNQGWGESDIQFLASLNSDDFRAAFKSCRDGELFDAVVTALRFEKYGDASNEMLAISDKARNALLDIATESRLNARRVRRFGLELAPAIPYPGTTQEDK